MSSDSYIPSWYITIIAARLGMAYAISSYFRIEKISLKQALRLAIPCIKSAICNREIVKLCCEFQTLMKIASEASYVCFQVKDI